MSLSILPILPFPPFPPFPHLLSYSPTVCLPIPHECRRRRAVCRSCVRSSSGRESFQS